MPAPVPSVVLHDLTFTWPDGHRVLDAVSGSFPPGSTGLVGLNGVGKSTLLRLIGGRLTPTSGSVQAAGVVDSLPQRTDAGPGRAVIDLLGIRSIVDAIAAVEQGEIDPALFDTIDTHWDIEEQAAAALSAAGMDIDDLHRPVSTISGGEAMIAALVGIRMRGADIALLDEPTNNLDADGRVRVHELIGAWNGPVIVVSHDLELLERMQNTAELRAGSLTLYGGPYSAFCEQVAREQEAAERAVRSAEHAVRVEKRQRIAAAERIAHSERQGKKDAVNRKYIGAVVNDRRNSAEKTQGKLRGLLDDRIQAAQRSLHDAESRIRDDDRVGIELPDPAVPSGKRIAELTGTDGRTMVLQGPERIAITGPNGVGKTTLLQGLIAGVAAAPGRAVAVAHVDRIGELSQRLDNLDDAASVIENVARVAPHMPRAELRNRLARLLVRGAMVDRPVGTLSGGERFRVALAHVLLADPPPQLIVLDEPTNNLDLHTTEQLIDALSAYRGAMIVVSHDRGFLDRLGLNAEFELDAEGVLTAMR
tara:strand:+ start:244 stop:1845 length:1602 start_codon:yes stop_codon:yes gene_type:complete